ncbi:MAG: RodZ domain-containing protein [Myxococcota bacterium]|nr:RodZ domain-containing protein [Myxococcota bacterium]
MIDLRHEREARGLSMDDVAERARIPRRYIEAMETGNTASLPPGPFLRGYRQQYLEFLDLPLDASTTLDEALPPEPDLERPLPVYTSSDLSQTFPVSAEPPVAKLILAGLLLCTIVVLGLRVGAVVLQGETMVDDPVALVAATSQKVTIRAIDRTRVEVFADDSWHHQGALPGGETITVESELPIEVTVGDLTRVVLHHDGSRIDPLHDLSTSRRLVFVPAPAAN